MDLDTFFTICLIVIGLSVATGIIIMLFDPWYSDAPGILAMLGFIGGFIGLLICAVIHDGRAKDALIAQCMADGKKEYECHAMLDDHNKVMPMPIIIPVR